MSGPGQHPASSVQNTAHSLKAKKDELTESVESILTKQPEMRNNMDAQILNKFIHKSSFFFNLVECFSMDVAKNVLRHSHIHEIAKNRMIAKRGDNLERIILFISGRIALVEVDPAEAQQEEESVQTYLNQMLQKSSVIARDIKRKTKDGKQDPNALAEFKSEKAKMFEYKLLKVFDEEYLLNIRAMAVGDKFTQSYVTVAPSMILSVSSKIFYQALAAYMKKVKSDKMGAFLKFDYFNQIESWRLIKIVDDMPLLTLKKGKFIFQEGEPFKYIYLLLSGGIKFTKNVDLFRENPNIFYIDRNKLKGGKAPQLPYANFSQVYNYKPKKKVVELGITSDTGIFGEEELFSTEPIRETSAQISTQTATFYVIDLQKLEAALPDKKNFIADMKAGLFRNQTENKILYRQQKLSELLMCENKNNMNYFYIEEGSSPSNDTKYKINKLNSMISPERSASRKNSMDLPTTSALYNTFNFPKLTHSSKGSRSFHLDVSEKQSKIMNLVHTAQTPKNDKEGDRKKHTKSSRLYSIDIKNPLFEAGYFQKKRKEGLRIDKESRMRPVGGGSTLRSRAKTSRPLMVDL